MVCGVGVTWWCDMWCDMGVTWARGRGRKSSWSHVHIFWTAPYRIQTKRVYIMQLAPVSITVPMRNQFANSLLCELNTAAARFDVYSSRDGMENDCNGSQSNGKPQAQRQPQVKPKAMANECNVLIPNDNTQKSPCKRKQSGEEQIEDEDAGFLHVYI